MSKIREPFSPAGLLSGAPPPRPRSLESAAADRPIDALDLAVGQVGPQHDAAHLAPLAPPAVLLRVPQKTSETASINQFLRAMQRPYGDGFSGIRIVALDQDGMGHLSAAVQALRQLRTMGLTGPIEIMFDKPEAGSKITRLLNNSADPAVQLREVSSGAAPARLTLCAATDTHDLSAFPKSDHTLVLQPYAWGDDRWLESRGVRTPLKIDHAAAAFQLAIPSYPSFTDGNAQELGLRGRSTFDDLRVRNMGAVHQAVRAGHIAISPMYGQYLDDALAPLTYSLRTAQVKAGADIPGVLVMWFNAEAPRLSGENPLASFGSAHLPGLLHDLRTGRQKIVFWHVGPVPQPVFNGLMALGTLPIVTEGSNTTNLARMLQRPYIPLCRPGPHPEREGFDLLRGFNDAALRFTDKGLLHAEKAARALVKTGRAAKRGQVSAAQAKQTVDITSDFFVLSQKRGSTVTRGFALAGRQNKLPTSDQLRVGLLQLMKQIKQAPSSIEQPQQRTSP